MYGYSSKDGKWLRSLAGSRYIDLAPHLYGWERWGYEKWGGDGEFKIKSSHRPPHCIYKDGTSAY